ncbi:MAG: hypothetical protein MZU79_08575 [Anaerotruncus sp.]|nr:hypothetical protein [Anaerotruncus sp.]MCK7490224.1 hypothetical protein [Anaerotruncus sp.]
MIGFPFEYGDGLTLENARKNWKEYSPVVFRIGMVALITYATPAVAKDTNPGPNSGTQVCTQNNQPSLSDVFSSLAVGAACAAAASGAGPIGWIVCGLVIVANIYK